MFTSNWRMQTLWIKKMPGGQQRGLERIPDMQAASVLLSPSWGHISHLRICTTALPAACVAHISLPQGKPACAFLLEWWLNREDRMW